MGQNKGAFHHCNIKTIKIELTYVQYKAWYELANKESCILKKTNKLEIVCQVKLIRKTCTSQLPN